MHIKTIKFCRKITSNVQTILLIKVSLPGLIARGKLVSCVNVFGSAVQWY